MRIVRTAMIAVLTLTLGCNADTALTTQPRPRSSAPAFVVAGSTVHLAAWYFPYGNVHAGSRMVVVSYEPLFPDPSPAFAGITYTAIVRLVHPEDGIPPSNFFTDTAMQPGTMLEAAGVPLAGQGTFVATVVRGPVE